MPTSLRAQWPGQDSPLVSGSNYLAGLYATTDPALLRALLLAATPLTSSPHRRWGRLGARWHHRHPLRAAPGWRPIGYDSDAGLGQQQRPVSCMDIRRPCLAAWPHRGRQERHIQHHQRGRGQPPHELHLTPTFWPAPELQPLLQLPALLSDRTDQSNHLRRPSRRLQCGSRQQSAVLLPVAIQRFGHSGRHVQVAMPSPMPKGLIRVYYTVVSHQCGWA